MCKDLLALCLTNTHSMAEFEDYDSLICATGNSHDQPRGTKRPHIDSARVGSKHTNDALLTYHRKNQTKYKIVVCRTARNSPNNPQTLHCVQVRPTPLKPPFKTAHPETILPSVISPRTTLFHARKPRLRRQERSHTVLSSPSILPRLQLLSPDVHINSSRLHAPAIDQYAATLAEKA